MDKIWDRCRLRYSISMLKEGLLIWKLGISRYPTFLRGHLGVGLIPDVVVATKSKKRVISIDPPRFNFIIETENALAALCNIY